MLTKSSVWVDKHLYDEAERKYYENLAKDIVVTCCSQPPVKKEQTPKNKSKQTDHISVETVHPGNEGNLLLKISEIENAINNLRKGFKPIEDLVKSFDQRLKLIESATISKLSPSTSQSNQNKQDDEADDGVDLFGSDSESEDDEAVKKIKEQRLAEYAAKKSKKPALVAKSNIIFDVKPWDDETDMKELEQAVRKVTMDGLIWGASKLVPLAYGIHKLQISSIVEDDKVSVDLLQEQIQEIEDYVQSVDIAAFNKV